MPGVSPCVLEVANPTQLDVLPFAWTDCGPGCSTTPTKVLASDEVVFGRAVSARVYDSEVHVRFSTIWAYHYYLTAVRRLSDGGLVAAVRAPGDTTMNCGPVGFAPSAPHVLGFFKGMMPGPDGLSTIGTYVVASLGANGLVWSAPAPNLSPIETSVLENDLGWGLALYDGTLRVKIPVDTGPLALIDQGSYPAYSAVGWGHLVISNPALPGSSDEVIRAWEPSRPSRTIVAQANSGIPAVALSDTAMAWVGVHGPGRSDGTYTAAELYFTPFPAGKDAVSVMGGIPLTEVGGTVELQTLGDYAAIMSADQSKKYLAITIARLSDGHLWILRHRPGAVFMRLLAISPAEIVVGENDDTGDSKLASQMQHLTRYEVARLDDLSAAW